jgi:hypothetical protein
VPSAATLDVDFTPGPGTLLGDYTAGQCALDEWDELDPSMVRRESAQSFTAGRTGEISRVALALTEIGDAPPLRIAIRAMVDGVPDGAVLGSATYDGPGSPDARTMTRIDLATPATVVAGGTYAVEVTTASCSIDGWWQVSIGMNGYSGGIAFVRAPGSSWGADSGADMFVQTWVR